MRRNAIPTIEAWASVVALSAPPPSPELRAKLGGMLGPVRASIRDARKTSR